MDYAHVFYIYFRRIRLTLAVNLVKLAGFVLFALS